MHRVGSYITKVNYHTNLIFLISFIVKKRCIFISGDILSGHSVLYAILAALKTLFFNAIPIMLTKFR